jgi:hypothetical protein
MAAAFQPNSKKTLPAGFQAQIRGANLWDLVQIECLARNSRVVRVTTVGNVGYLFFEGGNIVHASTREFEGEAAAFEVLQWNQGTFEVCERAWPDQPSITISWQNLLLRVAQAKDERARGKVVVLPSKERAAEPDDEPTLIAEVPMSMKTPTNGTAADWHVDDFEVAVRLAPNGDVLDSRGTVENFADMAAYAARIAEILGDLLGLEGFRGLEAASRKGRCLILMEQEGTVLAVKPSPRADVSLIKERIGL